MIVARRRADAFPGEYERILQRAAEAYEGQEGAIPAFEAAVRTRVGADAAAAVSSGRKAMTLIFQHLGIGPGHEVIVPAYTLKDLCTLIEKMGAKPVPAEIDPRTMNVTADGIRARITPQTRAILVLHAFGAACPLDRIVLLGEEFGIPVIEDAAHALGATYRGLDVGAMAYAGFYSFEWTKPVNTYGGGMVVSRDNDLIAAVRQGVAEDRPSLEGVAAKVKAIQAEERMFRTGLARIALWLLANPLTAPPLARIYRSFQRPPSAGVAYTPLQAELGLQKLATLDQRMEKRERLVASLRAHLRPDIPIQTVLPGSRSTWYFCVALLPCDAAPIRRKLLAKGIDAGVGEEIADDCAALLGYTDCPAAAQVFRRAIQIPVYESLDHKDMERIAATLNKLVPK